MIIWEIIKLFFCWYDYIIKKFQTSKKKTSKKAIQIGKLTGYKINIMKTNCFFPILAISIFSNWKWGNIQFSYKIIKFLDNNNYSHHNAMHSSKQSSQHPLEINYYYHSYFTEKNTEEREINWFTPDHWLVTC